MCILLELDLLHDGMFARAESYHIISEIYSAPITKRTWTTGALQKSAKCKKKPLILYAADSNIVLPTAHQWTLLERVMAILTLIEHTTRDVSAKKSSVIAT